MATSLYLIGSLWVTPDSDPFAAFASRFPRSCSIRFDSSMDRRDMDALMVDLPDDGEPEPGFGLSDEEEEDAAVMRTRDPHCCANGEEYSDVAKLSDGELVE